MVSGIISTDGELWQLQKKFTLRHMRVFGFGRHYESYQTRVEEEVQSLIEVIHKGNSVNHITDMFT